MPDFGFMQGADTAGRMGGNPYLQNQSSQFQNSYMNPQYQNSFTNPMTQLTGLGGQSAGMMGGLPSFGSSGLTSPPPSVMPQQSFQPMGAPAAMQQPQQPMPQGNPMVQGNPAIQGNLQTQLPAGPMPGMSPSITGMAPTPNQQQVMMQGLFGGA